MNASAVSDAQRNADINGIKNCKFVCGKAQNVIGSLMKDYLSLPEKQDEICDRLENTAHEVYNTGEKTADEDCILDHEDDCSESKFLNDKNQLQNNRKSESNTPVQQFKNVVAIVDPPRPEPHPTVIKVLRTQSRLKKLVGFYSNQPRKRKA